MTVQAIPFKTDENQRRRLQWLMFFRVVIVTFFLGMAAVTHLLKEDTYFDDSYVVYIYGLIGSIYVVTIVYLAILSVVKNLSRFIYLQISVDIFFITALIFITGGRSSIYPFMYSISIISASIFLFLPGGLVAASLSSFLYTLMISCQHYGLVKPLGASFVALTGDTAVPFYYPVIVNISSFYLVALLSSFLAEQTKKSQLQLKEKQVDIENLEALNENIIQSINSGLLTLDLDGRVVSLNQAACDITGYPAFQMLHRPIRDIFPDIVIPHVRDISDDDFAIPRFEMSYKREDGKIFYLGFSVSVLKNKGGQGIGRILGFQDLTSFKEMQESVKRMDRLAAVGRLAAGIAHEVRNPLASISGSAQMLSKNLDISPEDKRLLDIIVRESSNLNLLISDFTQFARPVKQDREVVNLKKTVAEVVSLFKNSPDCSGLENIRMDIRDDLQVNVGQQQFSQVLWNLMINAAQSISDDTGEISVAAREMEDGFQPVDGMDDRKDKAALTWLELTIRDTGCGIDRSDLDRIFDPFYTTKDRGTGLGLSIVYKIVQDMEGVILVDSEVGRGTVFSIYLQRY